MSEADPDDVVAAAERRLAEVRRQRARADHNDWDTVWRQMQALLRELAGSALFADDIHVRALLIDMMAAPDPEALALRFETLAVYAEARVAEHLAARVARGELTEAEAEARQGRAARGIHARAPTETTAAATPADLRPARTVLRL